MCTGLEMARDTRTEGDTSRLAGTMERVRAARRAGLDDDDASGSTCSAG
jgi:hypothetical protein